MMVPCVHCKTKVYVPKKYKVTIYCCDSCGAKVQEEFRHLTWEQISEIAEKTLKEKPLVTRK